MGTPIPEHELEALTRYVVGEMSDEEQRQFQQRLEQSAALREEHELLRSAFQTVRGDSGSPALTEERREAVRLAANAAVPARRAAVWIPLAAAAAVVLTAFLAVQYGGDGGNAVEVTRTGEVQDPEATGIQDVMMDGLGREGQYADREVRDRLRELGYVDGSGNGTHEDTTVRSSLEETGYLGGDDSEAVLVDEALSREVEIERHEALGYIGDTAPAEPQPQPDATLLKRAEPRGPLDAPTSAGVEFDTLTAALDDEELKVALREYGAQVNVTTPDNENLALLVAGGELNGKSSLEAGRPLQEQQAQYKEPGDSTPNTTAGVAPTENPSTDPTVWPRAIRRVETGGGGGGSAGATRPSDSSRQPTASAPPAAGAPAVNTATPSTPAPVTRHDGTTVQGSTGFLTGRTAKNEAASGETPLGESFDLYWDGDASGEPVEVTFGTSLGLAWTPTEVAQLESSMYGLLDDAGRDRGGRGLDAGQLVDQLLSRLARHPGETPDMMFFRYWGDNPSVQTRLDALSTFALDVDTASFTLIRNYLSKAILPPKAAVRTEEFVNAFDYHLTPPTDDTDVFAIHTELGPSPFGTPGMRLLRVGLKAREVTEEERKPVALTFVIDVSGSMDRENRIELVKQSLKLLVSQLDERDTIGIVTFQSTAQQVLAPHSMQHRQLILGAIDSLGAGGSTNAGEGLRLGFQMALNQFNEEGENRILLCSDGVANTGVTDVDGILRSVEKYREGRIYLNSVGVGMGNHNDALLEQLANKGDGFYAYVDTLAEAKRIFVDEMVGTMQTVAGEARAQVEFHPEAVTRYRLLGYENRAVADADFRSTSIDAGEIGAGHEVTALYELECVENTDGPYATVRVFSQDPDSNEWVEQSQDVHTGASAGELGLTTPQFRLAASVGEFAEILRQSIWSRNGSLGEVLAVAEPLIQELDGDGDVAEFVALVRQASRLPDLLPVRGELSQMLDELKRSQHLEAMLDDVMSQKGHTITPPLEEQIPQLKQQNDELERKIRELIEQRLRGDC